MGVWNATAAIVPGAYVEGVARAGGTPVLLPPVGTDPEVLDLVDGLVVIGGVDVDPQFYGAEPHVRTSSQPSRDEHDIALTRRALDMELPLFAICRGAQILNVALGGHSFSTCRTSIQRPRSTSLSPAGTARCGSTQSLGADVLNCSDPRLNRLVITIRRLTGWPMDCWSRRAPRTAPWKLWKPQRGMDPGRPVPSRGEPTGRASLRWLCVRGQEYALRRQIGR